MFRQNTGIGDRDIRIVLAAVFGLIALFSPIAGLWQLVPAILALTMLVTAALGFCPIYAMLGLNTCRVKTKPDAHKEA